jgi:hypothetical protein
VPIDTELTHEPPVQLKLVTVFALVPRVLHTLPGSLAVQSTPGVSVVAGQSAFDEQLAFGTHTLAEHVPEAPEHGCPWVTALQLCVVA